MSEQTARDALVELVDAVTAEVNEKGASGFLLARLTDARRALSASSPATHLGRVVVPAEPPSPSGQAEMRRHVLLWAEQAEADGGPIKVGPGPLRLIAHYLQPVATP